MHPPDSDWPDVRALRLGEDAALDRLMERHQARLTAFVARMIGDWSDAEEIAQETFVRVYFQINRYEPRAPFAAWLYQIARNLCRDYFRSARFKEKQRSEVFEQTKHDDCSPDHDQRTTTERVEAVQSALLKVPAKLRECLVLTAIEGLSHAEAASRLGISAKAVEVRAYRARKALEKILKII